MTTTSQAPAMREMPSTGRAAGWLRGSRGGLLAIALVVGAGAGLGAVAFRYLIYFVTWLATGHVQFGQQGRVPSSICPGSGWRFFIVIPVIGGLIYGPLIYRYAREARGHGVPEVMIAVADEGGRIRPEVAAVKSVASAICIGVGGSVGREGPIVQIGSALASSLGQWVKMPENRLRILVACGAAGGISATFNAPITGVFFGVEIILRELSVEAVFTVMLSALTADIVRRQFVGAAPFLSGLPAGISLHHLTTYLLIAGPRRGRGPDRARISRRSSTRPRTCATGSGRTAPNGLAPPPAASCSGCCCSPSRRCAESATPSCTRPSAAATPCGS